MTSPDVRIQRLRRELVASGQLGDFVLGALTGMREEDLRRVAVTTEKLLGILEATRSFAERADEVLANHSLLQASNGEWTYINKQLMIFGGRSEHFRFRLPATSIRDARVTIHKQPATGPGSASANVNGNCVTETELGDEGRASLALGNLSPGDEGEVFVHNSSAGVLVVDLALVGSVP